MGTDVLLYAEITVGDEELSGANTKFNELVPNFGGYKDKPSLQYLDYDFYDGPRVEVYTLSRYFSPYYHRGQWPQIYKAIRAMQTIFPDAQTYYGGDTSDNVAPVTEEFLGECWMAWFDLKERGGT